MNLSSITIAKNEEQNIVRCIQSLIGCIDDIVVLIDESTTDNTLELVKKFPQVNCQVVKWEGFSKTKQNAIKLTENDWILWIDADEALSENLKKEISEFKTKTPEFKSYKFPRIANFLGKWIKHSGWYPGYVTRLFDKTRVNFSSSDVHEYLQVSEREGKFLNDIEHYTDPDIKHYFSKFNNYTSLAANELYDKGKKFSILDIIVRPVWLFVKMYFIKAGFLDGLHGFILAVFSSLYVFTKYCKLMELNNRQKKL